MTRRRALPGRQDVTNLNSGLNEVECEAADLVCKVAGNGLAILDDLAVQIELSAALGQVIDRAIDVVAADGDVAIGAAAGASFIVAPGFDPEVCKHVIDKGGIMMPGTA